MSSVVPKERCSVQLQSSEDRSQLTGMASTQVASGAVFKISTNPVAITASGGPTPTIEASDNEGANGNVADASARPTIEIDAAVEEDRQDPEKALANDEDPSNKGSPERKPSKTSTGSSPRSALRHRRKMEDLEVSTTNLDPKNRKPKPKVQAAEQEKKNARSELPKQKKKKEQEEPKSPPVITTCCFGCRRPRSQKPPGRKA